MQRNSKAIGYGQQKMGKGIKTDSRLQIALNADNCWPDEQSGDKKARRPLLCLT